MSEVSCHAALTLATARAAGISDADALRLEAHLSACARCRAEVRVLDRVVRVGQSVTAAAPGAAARALARALAGEPSALSRAPRRAAGASPVRAALAVAAAVLVAAAFAQWAAAPAPPDAGAAHGHARAASRTRMTVAHATLELEPEAEIDWSGSVVLLRAGRMRVSVDRAPHRPFRVETPRFTVHVTGTVFAVSLDDVAVAEGSVEVRAPDGALLSRLRGGERWETFGLEAAAAPAGAPRASPRALVPDPRSEPPVAEPGASDDLVARATAELPRALAPPAVAAPAEAPPARGGPPAPSARERFARAAALEASDADRADALYDALEREGGAWGANALFARASLALHRGRTETARALLERYLRLHPTGPNAADARALLAGD